MMATRTRQTGLTLLELSITIVVGVILITGVFGLGTEASRMVSDVDDQSVVRFEADRAFVRLSEVLRKTGWSVVGEEEYPQVSEDRSELQFRVLEDLDGNGYPFNQTTGDLEWSATTYLVKRDPELGMLAIYQGENPVWTLGRHIDEVEFVTFRQDNTVFLSEVQVRIVARRDGHLGIPVVYTAAGSIQMRN